MARKPPIGGTATSEWANSGFAPEGATGTGTATTIGDIMKVTGGALKSEVKPGMYVYGATAQEMCRILNIQDDETLQLDQAPVTAMSAEAFSYIRPQFTSLKVRNVHASATATVAGVSLAAGSSYEIPQKIHGLTKVIPPIAYNKDSAELVFEVYY